MRISYTFEVVKHRAEKTGKCKCGKRLKRSMTFEQTINPFNVDAAGVPKSRGLILAELVDEAETWQKEPVVCSECQP